jgi:hypothetical protein
MLVPSGAMVSLEAKPGGDSTFAGWSGACSGSGDCSLTANSDVTVWANFANPPPPPPPPPAQCSGLTPGPPGPAMSISNNTQASCGPGIGDPLGTLGLQSFGSPSGTALHIVDSNTGRQNGVVDYAANNNFWQPTRDGFTGVLVSASGSAHGYTLEYWRHDGAFIQLGQTFYGNAVFNGTPSGTVLAAGDFERSGLPARHQLFIYGWNATDLHCAGALASRGTVFGLGGNTEGRALIITDGGAGNIDAQWFDADCGPLTGAFRLINGLQAGINTWFETAPLIGGGVAVRRVDQQNDSTGRPYRTASWILTLQTGSDTPLPAPNWMTDRSNTNFAIARSGRAYAVLPMGGPDASCAQKVEVLAPDGTACGSFDTTIASGSCRTEDMGFGQDGTPVQLMPRNLSSAGTCYYRWWPHALR